MKSKLNNFSDINIDTQKPTNDLLIDNKNRLLKEIKEEYSYE